MWKTYCLSVCLCFAYLKLAIPVTVQSAAARWLELRFRIPSGTWTSRVNVVDMQVEVSASSWSLVQRSPTECGTECDRVASIIRRPWPTEGCRARRKKYIWSYRSICRMSVVRRFRFTFLLGLANWCFSSRSKRLLLKFIRNHDCIVYCLRGDCVMSQCWMESFGLQEIGSSCKWSVHYIKCRPVYDLQLFSIHFWVNIKDSASKGGNAVVNTTNSYWGLGAAILTETFRDSNRHFGHVALQPRMVPPTFSQSVIHWLFCY
jgi:hypothetical protein